MAPSHLIVTRKTRFFSSGAQRIAENRRDYCRSCSPVLFGALFPKRAVFLNCVITGFRSRDAEQIVAAYRLIDAIQVCEGRTMRPKAGGRPTIKPKTVKEGMLRLQRLSEKWSALYQPPKKSDSAETSSTSFSAQVAPPALKQEIKDFFAVEGLTESASPALKEQVVGFLKTPRTRSRRSARLSQPSKNGSRDRTRSRVPSSSGRRP